MIHGDEDGTAVGGDRGRRGRARVAPRRDRAHPTERWCWNGRCRRAAPQPAIHVSCTTGAGAPRELWPVPSPGPRAPRASSRPRRTRHGEREAWWLAAVLAASACGGAGVEERGTGGTTAGNTGTDGGGQAGSAGTGGGTGGTGASGGGGLGAGFFRSLHHELRAARDRLRHRLRRRAREGGRAHDPLPARLLRRLLVRRSSRP